MSQTPYTNIHTPVLLAEVIDALTHNLDERIGSKKLIFVDGTFGGGGYSYSLGQSLKESTIVDFRILASDLDSLAITKADLELLDQNHIELSQTNFLNLINSCEDDSLAGIMLDLGFSSNQLTYGERGFSYQDGDQVLDLRFDSNGGRSCSQKLFQLKDAEALRKVIFRFSGEKFSNSIARHIFELVLKIKKTPNHTTDIQVSQIVAAVEIAVPAKFKKNLISTLSRVWQALRIWTNDEFGSLESVLPIALDKLQSGGRLVIVDFHSLEDKIVASFMRQASTRLVIDSLGTKAQDFVLLTPRGIHPSEVEISDNPRSRSAIMRVLEKA